MFLLKNCRIYDVAENVFWLAAKSIYQFLFYLTYWGWTIKLFFGVSFLRFDFDVLDRDNLTGVAHCVISCKISFCDHRDDYCFSIDTESCFTLDGDGLDLHLYNVSLMHSLLGR